jgi:dihydroorotase
MWPNKGRIAVGALADIAALNMTREEVIGASRLHSRGKITPFEGRKTVGAPVHTIVRGAFVQRDRQMVEGMAGHGRQVTDIQKMPTAKPQNVDQSLSQIIGDRGTT